MQPRSTQRYRGRQRGKDAALAAELRRISAAHPRAGYRMATALLRRAGMEINAKRVQRLWRQEGVKVPRRQRKRQRLGAARAARSGCGPIGSTMCGATTLSLTKPRIEEAEGTSGGW